jgi:hypothetical protein
MVGGYLAISIAQISAPPFFKNFTRRKVQSLGKKRNERMIR